MRKMPPPLLTPPFNIVADTVAVAVAVAVAVIVVCCCCCCFRNHPEEFQWWRKNFLLLITLSFSRHQHWTKGVFWHCSYYVASGHIHLNFFFLVRACLVVVVFFIISNFSSLFLIPLFFYEFLFQHRLLLI